MPEHQQNIRCSIALERGLFPLEQNVWNRLRRATNGKKSLANRVTLFFCKNMLIAFATSLDRLSSMSDYLNKIAQKCNNLLQSKRKIWRVAFLKIWNVTLRETFWVPGSCVDLQRTNDMLFGEVGVWNQTWCKRKWTFFVPRNYDSRGVCITTTTIDDFEADVWFGDSNGALLAAYQHVTALKITGSAAVS